MEKYLYSQETRKFISKINLIKPEDDPLAVARTVLRFFESHKVSEVDFKGVRYIWTNKYYGGSASRKVVLAAPSECYLDLPVGDDTGLRYAEIIHRKKGINEIYCQLAKNELKQWVEFLKSQGIYHTLAVKKEDYGTGCQYDYSVQYLSEYIKLKNPSLNKFIWNYFVIDRNWQYDYAFKSHKINRNTSARVKESSIVQVLKRSTWVAGRDGKLYPPSKVSESTIADGWLINEDNGFLHTIGFGNEQQAKGAESQRQEDLKQVEREFDKEAAYKLGFSSVEDVVSAKEDSRMVAELMEMGIDVRELYNTKKKERIAKKYSVQDQLEQMRENEFHAEEAFDDGESYRVKAPEQQTEKIKKGIAEEKEPEKKTGISKRAVINEDEKQKEKSRTEDIVHTVKSSTQYHTGELNSNTQKSNVAIIVQAGDRCPNCGRSNAHVSVFTMLGKRGTKHMVKGRICKCGIKYFTKKQGNKLPPDIEIKKVKGLAPIQEVKKKKPNSSVMTKRNKKQSQSSRKDGTMCCKCHQRTTLFAGTGMCWPCYKEEMASRFE